MQQSNNKQNLTANKILQQTKFYSKRNFTADKI